MNIGHITGATHTLGKPAEMTDEQCAPLPVRVDIYADGLSTMVVMSSAWLPTAEELARLNAGAPVHVAIYGAVHPPINVTVPEDY